jgi:hypothetical protein
MRNHHNPETIDGPAPRGRPFAKGNSGRKPGSQNRATRIAVELLDSEAEELVRTAIDLAKSGDVTVLKLLLSRILPKEAAVHIDFRPRDGDVDPVDAMGTIIDAAGNGLILPGQAASLASIVTAYTQIIDFTEVRGRLEVIEKHLAVLGTP